MKKIKLTQGQFALVDDEDYENLNQYKWYAAKVKSGDFYAQRMDYSGGNKKIIKMHRFILGLVDEKVHVDHGNGNTLDNQKHNIRGCTHKDNVRNRGITKRSTCGYKGVFYEKAAKKWRAQLNKDGKKIHLGLFEFIEDAAKAYNAAALIHHGEFARINQL